MQRGRPPLSRGADWFTTASTNRAIKMIMAGEGPSFAQAAWTTLVRGGIDAMSGQVALGLQRASMQAVTASTWKDAAEVGDEFWRGVGDPSLVGFHAMALAGAAGKMTRSAAAVYQINKLTKALENALFIDGFRLKP